MGDFSIQISADLVNQLLNDDKNTKKRPKKIKQKATQQSPKIKAKVNEKQQDDSETLKSITTPGWSAQPPLFFPVTPVPQQANAELEAIRSVVKESEKVLEKLQKQEDNMVREVTERAKDLHDKEFKLSYQKPMPCMADYDACRTCYKENGHDILKCAPLTKSYYDCVRRAKQHVSSTDE